MSEEAPRCAACGVELAPGLRACPGCRRLVHRDRLKTLAAEAQAAEGEGRLADAVTRWREALDLLPGDANQAGAVRDTIRRLSETIDRAGGGGAAPAPGAKGGAGGKATGLGALALVAWKLKFALLSFLAKAKLLVTGLASLPTLLSMGAYFAVFQSNGTLFVGALVLSIYVHEMGHVWALRRFGIAATAPMFIPGLGALVRLRQYPVDAREDARAGLAGPLWGCFACAAALALGLALHQAALLQAASWGAALNLFNLTPFWQLDGARGFRALDTRQRGVVVGLAAAAALLLDQPWCWLVCVVGSFRLKSDLPPKADATAFRTMAGLVAALSLLAWAAGKVG